jgi:hypothetical protein
LHYYVNNADRTEPFLHKETPPAMPERLKIKGHSF